MTPKKKNVFKTAFSLTPESLAIIDHVAQDFDPPNRSAALRQIIREWAEVYIPIRMAVKFNEGNKS